jgi:hypothetical protein
VQKPDKSDGDTNQLKINRLLAVEAVRSELVSARRFPVLRENTGKFADFRLKTTMIRRLRSGNSIAYQRISLSVKTGKNFRAIRE